MRLRVLACSMLAGGALLLQPGVSADGFFVPSAQAQTQTLTSAQTQSRANFDVFKPNPVRTSTFDYSILNDALSKVVLDFGPSTRLRARRVQADVGSRFVRGHKSAYRLEGARFTFEYISDDYKQGLTDYRLDLQDLATKYDITKFSKDEQLAYWINLHNVAVLEKIAEDYPVQRPDRMKLKIGDVKYRFDDAPFIEIKGQNISLSDIRKNIVFKNWNEDTVIYGFFRGDIGSPSLQTWAYTGENVWSQLNQNADDFVNSLRGFNLGTKTRNVSAIYEEAAPYYFQNWDADLNSHLLQHAGEAAKADLARTYPFQIDTYDTMVADVSGGQGKGTSGVNSSCPAHMSCGTARLLREVETKRQYLIRNDLMKRRRGYVIIEDLVPEEDKVN